jgi:hypothetical protein
LARNANVRDKILLYKEKLLQQADPIFQEPLLPAHFLDYRTQFLAPSKHFAGMLINTYYFDIIVIWLFSLVLYITLYYETFKKALSLSIFGFFKKTEKNKTKK